MEPDDENDVFTFVVYFFILILAVGFISFL